MRPDRVRLGVLAAVTLFVFPVPRSRKRRRALTRRLLNCGSFLPTSARRSIARLESSRSRGENWRRCRSGSKVRTGVRRNDVGLNVPATTTAAAAVGTQAAVTQQPTSRTAAEPTPDLPAMVVSAGDFPGSIRIPGTESSIKLGGQARMVARQQEWRPRIVESDSGRLDAQVLTRGRALSRLKTLEGKTPCLTPPG